MGLTYEPLARDGVQSSSNGWFTGSLHFSAPEPTLRVWHEPVAASLDLTLDPPPSPTTLTTHLRPKRPGAFGCPCRFDGAAGISFTTSPIGPTGHVCTNRCSARELTTTSDSTFSPTICSIYGTSLFCLLRFESPGPLGSGAGEGSMPDAEPAPTAGSDDDLFAGGSQGLRTCRRGRLDRPWRGRSAHSGLGPCSG